MQNNYVLSPLTKEYFEDLREDPLGLTPHSNQSSENKNISSQLDTFTSDENDQNKKYLFVGDSKKIDGEQNNEENQSEPIIAKMGQMLASTIFVYAYFNISKWALNWVARNAFKVKGEMFSWNIYKLIHK